MKLSLGLGFGLARQGGNNPDPGNLYTWVSTTRGTDDTIANGYGTWLKPFKTMAYCEAQTNTKTTIYVESGTYELSSTLALTKAYNWVAYGAVTLKNTGSSYIIQISGATNTVLNGFTIDQNSKAQHAILLTGATKTLRNCTFIGAASNKAVITLAITTAVIDGCTFNGNSVYAIANTGNYANTITVTNNTFNGTYTDTFVWVGDGTDDDTATISGNTFNYYGGNIIDVGDGLTLVFSTNTINYMNTITGAPAINCSTGTGLTQDITIDGNTFNLGAYNYSNTGAGICYADGETNTVSVAFTNNIIEAPTNTLLANKVIVCNDCVSVKIDSNTFDLSGTTNLSGVIFVQNPTKLTTGEMTCNSNIIKTITLTGSNIWFGTDEPVEGSDDNMVELVIDGNLIYGARYYDNSITELPGHTLFVGYQKDCLIQHNMLIGCFAIILEHTNGSAFTSGGICYNVMVDCLRPIVAGGPDDLYIIGNTIVNYLPMQNNALSVILNVAGGEGTMTGAVVKNNILYAYDSNSKYLLYKGEDVTATCDYNWYYTDGLKAVNYEGTAVLSFAEWQGAPYNQEAHGTGQTTAPQLTVLTGITANETCATDPRPIAEANVIGIGENLGTDYDDAMNITSVPPTIVTKEQPSAPDLWTLGAYIR
jgi:hypothetical protein